MWFKKVEDIKGKYQDKEEKRFRLLQCHQAHGPNGKREKDLGLTEFKDIEECLKAWELTEVKEEEKK